MKVGSVATFSKHPPSPKQPSLSGLRRELTGKEVLKYAS